MNRMNCPHCNKPIPDKLIAKYLASKGGKAKGNKARTSEQARGQPFSDDPHGLDGPRSERRIAGQKIFENTFIFCVDIKLGEGIVVA